MTKTRLKFFTLKIGSGKTPRGGSSIYSESGIMLLRSQNVHFKGLRLDDVVFVSEEIDEDMKNTRVYSGDVLLNITGASLGRCTVAPSDFPSANVSQHVSIIRCNENRLNPQYLFYNLQGAEIQNKIWGDENGSSREGLTSQQIGDFLIEVIPLENQNKVAGYLDRETTQIDNLIAAKEQMLTLLEEKREALISHAVTRGLDPNVAFKRSGLDWLGDIPQHWNIIRLKHLAKEALAYGANEAALEDNPIYPRFIRITDIRDDGSLRPETFKSLSPEVAKPYLLSDGDVLLARSGATVGKAFIYRKEWGTACFAGYLIRCRCNKELLIPSFLFYYTQSSSYWSQVYAGTIQATIQNFSGEKYGDIFIPIPPLSEQKDILNFLDYETSKLDGLLGAIKESIALLKERRSALITAAVTGQIALEGNYDYNQP